MCHNTDRVRFSFEVSVQIVKIINPVKAESHVYIVVKTDAEQPRLR